MFQLEMSQTVVVLVDRTQIQTESKPLTGEERMTTQGAPAGVAPLWGIPSFRPG